MKIILSATLLLLFSCTKPPNLDECEDLSMDKFKGFPNASHRFDKYCQDMPIKYTQKVCHSALTSLVMNGNIEKVKKTFGPKVVRCFTENDLINFKKKQNTKKPQ